MCVKSETKSEDVAAEHENVGAADNQSELEEFAKERVEKLNWMTIFGAVLLLTAATRFHKVLEPDHICWSYMLGMRGGLPTLVHNGADLKFAFTLFAGVRPLNGGYSLRETASK